MEFNQEESSKKGGFKQWFQDNLRIIVSIIVVVIIATGIYSFSNRSMEVDEMQTEEASEQADILDQIIDQEGATDASQVADGADSSVEKEEVEVPASQETEGSFIETAASGDGTTKLARRALANYLEKNIDSELTAEHKIYIEDYLRKNISVNGGVKVGTSVEFSKSLIQEAISASKNLNESQLNNLHKYVLRVPSLQ